MKRRNLVIFALLSVGLFVSVSSAQPPDWDFVAFIYDQRISLTSGNIRGAHGTYFYSDGFFIWTDIFTIGFEDSYDIFVCTSSAYSDLLDGESASVYILTHEDDDGLVELWFAIPFAADWYVCVVPQGNFDLHLIVELWEWDGAGEPDVTTETQQYQLDDSEPPPTTPTTPTTPTMPTINIPFELLLLGFALACGALVITIVVGVIWLRKSTRDQGA